MLFRDDIILMVVWWVFCFEILPGKYEYDISLIIYLIYIMHIMLIIILYIKICTSFFEIKCLFYNAVA